jgi:hypothetical protein
MKKLINPTKASILATLPPPSTRTYKTISHGAIIDTIFEELDKKGLKVINERYSSNYSHTVVNGHLELGMDSDPDLYFEIAFLNSYDKTKRAVVIAGSAVRMCDNGHILGDTSYGAFKRKHVGDASEKITLFIPEMISTADKTFDKLKRQKERMKEIDISTHIRNELVGQLYLDDAIVTDTQMSILKREIENPSFNYGQEGSLWQLYNHVTLAMKDTHPSKWIENHQKFNKVVTDKFQLV